MQLEVRFSRTGVSVLLESQLGHFGIATMILDKNTKLPMRLRKEICYWAAGYGYDELVVAMLDTGLDVNKVNCEASTPLAEAATGGHYSTVRLLLDRGANVRQFGKDAFVYAAGAGRIEILEMLLQRGIDMEAESRMLCAFLAATEAGNFAGVQFLLDNGLDIRSADAKIWRYRALRGAIWCNRKNVDMVRWLVLNLGVSPDGDNGDPHAAFTNTSPMATALEMGRPEIVNLLFQLGAKLIDLTDSRFTYWTQGVCMTPKQLDAFDQYHRWEEAKRYQAAGYSMDPTMSGVAQRQDSL